MWMEIIWRWEGQQPRMVTLDADCSISRVIDMRKPLKVGYVLKTKAG